VLGRGEGGLTVAELWLKQPQKGTAGLHKANGPRAAKS
jgi:hypothetical protein